jgi:hypothetical protein
MPKYFPRAERPSTVELLPGKIRGFAKGNQGIPDTFMPLNCLLYVCWKINVDCSPGGCMGKIVTDHVSVRVNQKTIEGIRCVLQKKEPEGFRQTIFFHGTVASDPVFYQAVDDENMLKAAKEILEEIYLENQK